MRLSCFVAVVGIIAIGNLPALAAVEADPAGLERFEKKVRPLLAARCWQCHGPEKHKGGLRLDSGTAIGAGGESGPVVLPGKPDQSRLIAAIGYAGELKMPPKGKLGDAEIAELTEWVRAGAVWPDAGTTRTEPAPRPAAGGPLFTTEQKSFWAFRPPRDPVPPGVKAAHWPTSVIDRFILSQLEKNGLTPAPQADRRTLIRRATFDLTGLPPSPAEVDAFVADQSADAFAKVVDRLLASPRYGERWGRHWLDLARYADSNGMDENVAYANAFRYRDYVIRAFNADSPYDQFVMEQLAGDQLAPSGDKMLNHDRLTATGFLVLGPKMLAEDDPMKMEMDIIDEQVDTVGRVFMGLTLGCARCHDHKFDPIPTADYYSLAGIFKSTKSMQNHKVVAMWNERALATEEGRKKLEAHKKEVARREAEIKKLAGKGGTQSKEDLRRLRDNLAELQKQAPPIAEAMSVEDQAIANLRVHVRGNHLTLGEEVPRRFLRVLAGENQRPLESSRSGRLELAEWLTARDHPLTSRVMINRLWLWHFGEGLVGSPDNFGRLGDRPVNLELLDWLARRFIASGWSLKNMHRVIMLSSTYQMSSRLDAVAAQVDPENHLHWRANRRRLEAEEIRDAILAVSGQLDVTMGGTLLTEKSHAYVNSTTRSGATAYAVSRRSVYLPVIRSGLYDVFQAFDFADPSASNGKRIPTTVAPQALFMMNDKLVLRCAEAMARHLLDLRNLDDTGRILKAYLAAYGRPPTDREIARAKEYLGRFAVILESQGVGSESRSLQSWQALCQSIIASSEFIYLN
jgi:mono/diheme cytochrome c family protein